MKLNTLTKLMKWIAVSMSICWATSLVGSPGISEATTEVGFLFSSGHQMSTAPPSSEISADGYVIKNAATNSIIKIEMDELAITQLIAEESSTICEIQAIVSEEKRQEEGMSTNVLSKARAVIIRGTVDLKEGSLASASTETGNLSGYGVFGNYSLEVIAVDTSEVWKGSASPGD